MLHHSPLQPGTDLYGHAIEHLVVQEIRAFVSYKYNDVKKIWYWRTLDNKYEVDLIIGDAEVAIEIKASNNISSKDTKGLRIFSEEHPEAKLFLISMETTPRKQDGVAFWNIEDFLRRLWKGQIL